MVIYSKTMSSPHSLSKKQVERYSRQLLVGDFGVEGQEHLLSSKVLIVGAGGLGCPCASYLVASGIGTIGIVDFDTVSVDNLHRQIGHKEKNVGRKKTESLRDTLSESNSSVRIICHSVAIDRHSALDIIKDYDVIVDCSDNAATRYLLNDACVLSNKPLVSGSALRWEGQLTVYNYGERCPCYRCIFPVPPSPHLVTNCAEGGVLGPVVGTIGSMQALEVIKIIGKCGTTYAGRLLLFDGQSGRMTTVTLRERSPKCQVCSPNPSITELVDYELFCGSGVHDKVGEVSLLSPSERVGVAEYALIRKGRGVVAEIEKDKGDEGAAPSVNCQRKIRLFDTRPPAEFNIGRLPEAISRQFDGIKGCRGDLDVTIDQLRNMKKETLIDTLRLREEDKEVFFICHRGNDSQLAVRTLQERLKEECPSIDLSSLNIRDIVGGYHAWADIVDSNFPVY